MIAPQTMLGGMVFSVPLLATLVIAGRAPARGWREAGVQALVLWGAGVVIVTEGLGAIGAFSLRPVMAVWLVIWLALVVAAVAAWRQRAPGPAHKLESAFEGAVALVLAGLAGLTLTAALAAPPNTLDVLSYHLPRQLMWLQQGSVAHFLTTDDRALMMPPAAEMIQAHALLLSGGDCWANMPQWIAYVAGMVVASLLAREAGAGRRGQWLAALMFAVLPMAYLEAASAKNDLLVAVWLAIFAWAAMRLTRAGGGTFADWAFAGSALGLALATKTTALVFGAPTALLLLPAAVRAGRRGAGCAVVVLLLVGPHWSRNLAWYGTPLGVHRLENGGGQGNTVFSGRAIASNLLRNATLHLATPSPAVNAALAAAVDRAHVALDQPLNDPRTTLWTLRYGVVWLPQSEPWAGAPVPVVLGLFAVGGACLVRPRRPAVLQLLALAAAGGFLYCLVLKWQPWGARLHLPAFVLLAAATGCVVAPWGRAASWLAAALGVFGWLPSVESDLRPLWTTPSVFAVSRWENSFRANPDDRACVEACLASLDAAGATSLQVVTRHGFPYAVMQRFLAARPERSLWGTMPSASTTPPSAVLLMEPFVRPLPLYVQPPGARQPYRAVGGAEPWSLYLPAALASASARGRTLPRFVGWDEAAGLEPAGSGGRGAPLRVSGDTVRLLFRASAPRMFVRLQAVNPSAQVCAVELRLNGRRIAAVKFDPGGGPQQVEVPLDLPSSHGELLLVLPGGTAPSPLEIHRLQIDDRPGG